MFFLSIKCKLYNTFEYSSSGLICSIKNKVINIYERKENTVEYCLLVKKKHSQNHDK